LLISDRLMSNLLVNDKITVFDSVFLALVILHNIKNDIKDRFILNYHIFYEIIIIINVYQLMFIIKRACFWLLLIFLRFHESSIKLMIF